MLVSEGEQGDWERTWNARQEVLESALGPADENVFHALIPLYLGGSADVLSFPSHVRGSTYVTADLVGPISEQLESSLGQYELMICTREPQDWAPELISRLAQYTFEAVLEPLETMDIGPALPEGSTIEALLFTAPQVKENSYRVFGQRFGLLLCLGITASELQACRDGRTLEVLRRLQEGEVFPYTDLARKATL